MMRPMKITDPRIMKTTALATIVTCGMLIGYMIAQVSRSAQDWVFLGSMTVILVCTMFEMFKDIWKRNA
jgi:hypothetical protein